MMGCCGHFSALSRSKNGVGLTVFPRLSSRHQGRVRRRSAGSLLELFVEILLAFFFFLPCREVKLLLDCRGRGGWKEDEWWGEQRPQLRGPRPATFTHVIFTNNEREPLRGQRWTGTADSQQAENAAGPPIALCRSLPSRWRVITYILPKMRICSVCHIYTNSDLQGEHRRQVISVRLHGDASRSLLHF